MPPDLRKLRPYRWLVRHRWTFFDAAVAGGLVVMTIQIGRALKTGAGLGSLS